VTPPPTWSKCPKCHLPTGTMLPVNPPRGEYTFECIECGHIWKTAINAPAPAPHTRRTT